MTNISGNSTHKSYEILKTLDINNDNKVTMDEVKFLQKVNGLLKTGKASPEELISLYKDLPPDEELRKTAASYIFRLSNRKVEISPFDSSVKLKKGLAMDEKITLVQDGKIKALTTLAADVLDGDGKISGVDKAISDKFSGEKYSPETGSVWTPNGFNFKPKISYDSGNQTAEATYDILSSSDEKNMDGYLAPAAINSLNKVLGQAKATIDGKEVTFSSYAALHGIDLTNIKPDDLSKVKNFVGGLQPDKRDEFISKFLKANFVHNGDGIDQENVTSKNYHNILGKFPKEEGSNRTMIDCTFYAAIAQELLRASPGVETTPVVYKEGDKEGTLHDVMVSVDAKNKQYVVYSNSEAHSVTIEDLQKIKGQGWKGDPPPSPDEVAKAAKAKVGKQLKQKISVVGIREAGIFDLRYKLTTTALKPGNTFILSSNDSQNGSDVKVLSPREYPNEEKFKHLNQGEGVVSIEAPNGDVENIIINLDYSTNNIKPGTLK